MPVTREDLDRALANTRDPEKIFQWLKSSGTSPDKVIFYYSKDGLKMLRAFKKANEGFQDYHDIFSNPKFYFDNGTDLTTAQDEESTNPKVFRQAILARSTALGRFAKNPYVFNYGASHETSVLRQEIAQMKYAGSITLLKDHALTANDVETVWGAKDLVRWSKPTISPDS